MSQKKAGCIIPLFLQAPDYLCVSICTNGSSCAVTGGGAVLFRRRCVSVVSPIASFLAGRTFSGWVSIMIRPLAARFSGSLTRAGWTNWASSRSSCLDTESETVASISATAIFSWVTSISSSDGPGMFVIEAGKFATAVSSIGSSASSSTDF